MLCLIDSGALFQALVASFIKVDLDRFEKLASSWTKPREVTLGGALFSDVCIFSILVGNLTDS